MDTLITRNSIQNPYKEFEILIPAFGISQVSYDFDYIRYLDFGGAQRGQILARIGSSGNESDVIGGGIGYKLTTAVQRVEFRNTTATPITIIIALAIGLISDDRLNFSGAISVENVVGGTLQVQDNNTAFQVTTIRNLMRETNNFEDNIAPKTTLIDAVYGERTTAGTSTLVTSAANTKGIIIRKGTCQHFYSTGFVTSIRVNNNVICGTSAITTAINTMFTESIQNIFIPSGQSLTLVCAGSTDCFVNAWYQVL